MILKFIAIMKAADEPHSFLKREKMNDCILNRDDVLFSPCIK